MRLSRWLITAFLAGVLAGCGGATSASSGSSAPGDASQGTTAGTSGAAVSGGDIVADPCVFEPSELTALLGGDDFPAGVVKQSSRSNAVCDWETQTALVSLTIEDYDSSLFEDFKDDAGSKPVADLGDDAFFGPLNILFVRKGGLDFTLQVVHLSMDVATLERAEIDLATLVVERI